MVLKDNYIGSFTHFSTLNEYLNSKRKNGPIGDPIQLKYREGKHNMLQVEMYLNVSQALITLPAGLLGYHTSDPTSTIVNEDDDSGANLMLWVPEITMHLRLHDFFMGMICRLLDCFRTDFAQKCPSILILRKVISTTTSQNAFPTLTFRSGNRSCSSTGSTLSRIASLVRCQARPHTFVYGRSELELFMPHCLPPRQAVWPLSETPSSITSLMTPMPPQTSLCHHWILTVRLHVLLFPQEG